MYIFYITKNINLKTFKYFTIILQIFYNYLKTNLHFYSKINSIIINIQNKTYLSLFL